MAASSIERACALCEHYGDAGKPQANQGACRRYPPTVFMVPIQVPISPQFPQGVAPGTQAFYPMVGAADHCGEYTPRSVVNLLSS